MKANKSGDTALTGKVIQKIFLPKQKEDKMNFDSGITGFMLLATSLVMLMTPGLAFFYGGLATKEIYLAS